MEVATNKEDGQENVKEVALSERGSQPEKTKAQANVPLSADVGGNRALKTRDYIVKEGDTLWIIAKEQYGDATFWEKIEEANGVENVSNLKLGQTLKLPIIKPEP